MNIYIKVLILVSVLCLLTKTKLETYTNQIKIDKESDIYQEDPGCEPSDKVMQRDMDLRDSHLYINKNMAKKPRSEMGSVSCKYDYSKRRSRGEFNNRYIPRNYKKWCLKTCEPSLDSDGQAQC